MDIVFVILHYKTYEDTVECVQSIQNKIDTDNYRIVVVDNASGNGTGAELEKLYHDVQEVTVLQNTDNFGFAKGLNVGIFYAKKKWDAKYIAAINNDTLLISHNFVSVLDEKYAQYGFSVAGPLMITRDGMCNVNPIRNTVRTKQDAERAIRRYKKITFLCTIRLYWLYKLFANHQKHDASSKKEAFMNDCINYKLHGACWIFSYQYFEKFDGLDPATFLYGEEDILYLHLMRRGMKTLYTPDLIIYHKEDSSTEATFSDNTQKAKFVSKNCIKSLQTYISIYQKYESEEKLLT